MATRTQRVVGTTRGSRKVGTPYYPSVRPGDSAVDNVRNSMRNWGEGGGISRGTGQGGNGRQEADAVNLPSDVITIEELDGLPTGQFSTLRVPNNSLTDEGLGVATLNFDGMGPVITIAASASHDLAIGPDTDFQAVGFSYTWLKNSKIGIGDGRMFSNEPAATEGANKVGETREESSQLAFAGVRAAGVLYLRITNGDGVNEIKLLLSVTAYATIS